MFGLAGFSFLLLTTALSIATAAELSCISSSGLTYTHNGPLKSIDVGTLEMQYVDITISNDPETIRTTTLEIAYTAMLFEELTLDVYKVENGDEVTVDTTFFSSPPTPAPDTTPSKASSTTAKNIFLSLFGAGLLANERNMPATLAATTMLCVASQVYGDGNTCIPAASLKVTLPYDSSFYMRGQQVIVTLGATQAPTLPTLAPTNKPTGPTIPPPTTPPPTYHPLSSNAAETFCQTPAGFRVLKGKEVDSDHKPENLRVKDETDAQDIWNQYVIFTPQVSPAAVDPLNEPQEAEVVFSFYFDNVAYSTTNQAGIPMTPQRISLSVHYKGTDAHEWDFYLADKNNNFQYLGSNQGAQDFKWSDLTYSVPLTVPIEQLIKNGREVNFYMRSIKGMNMDPVDIGYLEACIVGGAPTVSPTKSPLPPTPPPVPVPPTATPAVCSATPNSEFAEWSYRSSICGLYFPELPVDVIIDETLAKRKAEGCTSLMLDTRLSFFLDDTEFEKDAVFIDKVAQKALALGMKTTMYYPTLEIITKGIDKNDTVLASDVMGDWLQVGLDGRKNVFNGAQEVWVADDEESAWMDPENDDYINYFVTRVKRLAQTALSGFWGDVPLYYDTGVKWAGGGPLSASKFKAWSKAEGYCLPDGCDLPDWRPLMNWTYTQPEFAYWQLWRHHSLAGFLEKVRLGIKEVNPNMFYVVEVYNTDYVDSVTNGLDPSYYKDESHAGMTNVWEVDSISNQQAMKMASQEDMANQVTMRKFCKGMDRDKPAWTFGYGNEEIDASFVMAGAMVVGTPTLECKTPTMTTSSSTKMRTQFYNWVSDFSCQVYQMPRKSRIAIMYSSHTRDFSDFMGGSCGYAMYLETVDTTGSDTAYWAESEYDSLIKCEHLGDYRGLSYGLQMLNAQYKVVVDQQLLASDLDGIELLILPSTRSLPDNAVNVIKQYASNGGTVLAVGMVPAAVDHVGMDRSGPNPLAEVFGSFIRGPTYVHKYGNGLGIYRGDIDAVKFFENKMLHGHSTAKQKKMMDLMTPFVRLFVPERFIIQNMMYLHIEMSAITDQNTEIMYIFSYDGMQQPAVHSFRRIPMWFRAPDGKKVVAIGVDTPNYLPATRGTVPFTEMGDRWIDVHPITVDQFTLITFYYEDIPSSSSDTPYTGSTETKAALNFVKNSMIDPTTKGVYTNLNIPFFDDGTVYGKDTSSEGVGLLLEASHCLNDDALFAQTVSYVNTYMQSPALRIINSRIKYSDNKPMLREDTINPQMTIFWQTGYPLDDLRIASEMTKSSDAATKRKGEEIFTAIYYYARTTSIAGYPDGLIVPMFEWEEVDPRSYGVGTPKSSIIATSSQDIRSMEQAALTNPRWTTVMESCVKFLLAAEVPNVAGLFYNSYIPGRSSPWGGDWEKSEVIGEEKYHIKVEQALRVGLHLAAAASSSVLSTDTKNSAFQAANRVYSFFRTFYDRNGKSLPEYMSMAGQKPQNVGREEDEVRVLALLLRLGAELSKDSNSLRLIVVNSIMETKQTNGPASGSFGMDTAEPNDVNIWNHLEVLISLCQIKY